MILYGAPHSEHNAPAANENGRPGSAKKHGAANGCSKPYIALSHEKHQNFAAELDDDDEGALTDSRSDERDDYGESSRSTLSSSQSEQRTVMVRGLPDKVAHRHIVDAVKGGAILHIYLWNRDHTASISFVEETAAQDFLDHSRAYGLYVAEKRVSTTLQ